MATAKSLKIAWVWPFRLEGLWLRYATLQNLIPDFPWIAPSWWSGYAIQEKEGIKFCHLATLIGDIFLGLFGTNFCFLFLLFWDHPAPDLAPRLPSRRLHDALVGARVRVRTRPLPSTEALMDFKRICSEYGFNVAFQAGSCFKGSST